MKSKKPRKPKAWRAREDSRQACKEDLQDVLDALGYDVHPADSIMMLRARIREALEALALELNRQ